MRDVYGKVNIYINGGSAVRRLALEISLFENVQKTMKTMIDHLVANPLFTAGAPVRFSAIKADETFPIGVFPVGES